MSELHISVSAVHISVSAVHISVSAVHCSRQHLEACRVSARLISQLKSKSTFFIYYTIYHKIQYMFKFYLQIFSGVQYGFLVSRGRCPICKRCRTKSYETCPRL